MLKMNMHASREEKRRINAVRAKRNRRESVFTTNSTNRGMKSDVTVHLDKSTYVAGDVISGSVNVILTQEVKIKELTIRIHGQSRVSWDEQRSYTKGSAPSVSRKVTESYLDHIIVLLKKDKIPTPVSTNARNVRAIRPSLSSLSDMTSMSNVDATDADEGVFIPPGDHNFRFEYMLPHGLPSSYDGKWGQIRYSAKCVLERPWKFDIEREQEFNLRALTDLNDEPELARPIGSLGEFRSGLLCINLGYVNVEVRINRRGFVPGDNINCRVEVENGTNHKLYDIRLTLQQHSTYRVGKTTRKETQVLTSVKKRNILANETVIWENDLLSIPADTPPSTNKSIKSIHIKYTVTLHITHSSWRDEYTLPLVVIVGTEAFRKGVIQGYMNLIGGSNSMTPRQTPSNTPRSNRYNFVSNETVSPFANTKLPALMTRDQLCMRRASAYPGMMPTSPQKQLQVTTRGKDEALNSRSCNQKLTNTHHTNKPSSHHSSTSSLDKTRGRRRHSGSDCKLELPPGRTIPNTDLILVLDGERQYKPGHKTHKSDTAGIDYANCELTSGARTPKRGSLDNATPGKPQQGCNLLVTPTIIIDDQSNSSSTLNAIKESD